MGGDMTADGFDLIALGALRSSPVPQLLTRATAVVLERVARGAGETRWYIAEHESDLAAIELKLVPGSRVSFYFDDRLRFQPWGPHFVDEFLRVGGSEAVVGRRTGDPVRLDVDFPAGLSDLTDFVGSTAYGQPLLLGAFPAADNDGESAVTVTLPDRDGVVRRHPH
jgi:hypothetical protein